MVHRRVVSSHHESEGSSIKDSDDQSIHSPFSVPMAAGLGRGGEQEVHVAAEQPGWRSPDSKIWRARTESFVLLRVVVMPVHLTLSKASHFLYSANSLRDGEGTLLGMVPIITQSSDLPSASWDLVTTAQHPSVELPRVQEPFGVWFGTYLICPISRYPCADGMGHAILCRIFFP